MTPQGQSSRKKVKRAEKAKTKATDMDGEDETGFEEMPKEDDQTEN